MALNWLLSKRVRQRPDTEDVGARHPTSAGAADASSAPDTQELHWPDVVRHFGQEVAMALNSASDQLERLSQLEPSLVGSLQAVSEAVERARQAGMAAQHVLRLSEDPPAQHRELLGMDDVVRAVLTARADWLTRRQVSVRHGLAQTQVYVDSSMLYMLVDELLLWAAQLAPSIAVMVDRSRRTGRPRLSMLAWCDPSQVPDAAWHGMRWMLWHQLARSLGAVARMETHADHVRVTLNLAAVTEDQLATGIEESVGPSSVSAVIQGCRVLIISASAQRRAQSLQALTGYGLILDNASDMAEAERLATRHLPDAVVYDGSLNPSAIDRLRESLEARAGTPAAFIEIHDDDDGRADFHTSTIGSVSTGHIAAGSLNQALGPALVFELCKVM